jgi:hypothetical protein
LCGPILKRISPEKIKVAQPGELELLKGLPGIFIVVDPADTTLAGEHRP